MAVHAHPDDESSKGAATTAKYVADGIRVRVVSCTGGERGDILNDKLKGDPHIARDLAQVRRDEMARAAEILGVEHTWLGFVDSGLPEGDPLPPLPEGCFALEPVDVTAEALVRVIREFRPHVLTTYDENGGYPHPDHIMTHVVSMAAFRAAGDPAAYPHAGEPWQPQKVYYSGWSIKRIRAIHEAMEAEGLESPYKDWISGMRQRPERDIRTHVECGEYFAVRDDALRAHATQVDPDGFWFQVPLDLQRRVHPAEDWELAVSLVEPTFPEDDLFAGLRDLDLETVCRQAPERDADGEVVAVYRTVPPPPLDQDADGVDDARQTDDLEDEITELEGHHDSDEQAS
ncbi:mycothiol conjugate amidase Mca [Ornithinimicrobium cavernae]|uniref:mycothiol conjugate amidase Mca n=1 Tax=Ornithinimicrobium cavernae TaxID=2666047 RepID=UPI000D68A1A0|nr:mycothiol conjugate amidase Mca [Ornithinimicrobium cavernae]